MTTARVALADRVPELDELRRWETLALAILAWAAVAYLLVRAIVSGPMIAGAELVGGRRHERGAR